MWSFRKARGYGRGYRRALGRVGSGEGGGDFKCLILVTASTARKLRWSVGVEGSIDKFLGWGDARVDFEGHEERYYLLF